ncbi:hypothetical protein FB451DRAFT_1302131 [Mycena latifolia]|nr:hypothetical protein FB451DRAFT_1302131 [Mycena latifolia]
MNLTLVSRASRHYRLPLPNFRTTALVIHQRQCLRRFSTEERPNDSAPPQRPLWIVSASLCLGALGAGALAYAGYDAYTTWRNLFPIEVRGDLKRGIGAKNKGDLETSAYYKRKAWNTAISLPIEEFKTEPYLRLTGIAVDLAGELEEDGKTQEAFGLYSDALNLILNTKSPELLSGPERLRAISLAVKLGQLADTCAVPAEEEERIRVWAVEEILKLLTEIQGSSSTGEAPQPLDFVKLKLPRWMTKTDVSVPLQELGDFYGRVGKLEYALPLYLQGITLLVYGEPPSSSEETCQGAQLMNNIAELVIRHPTAERQKYAEAWAQKALSVLQATRKNTKEPISTCEQALSVALFNAGMLRELAGDQQRARSLFKSAFEQSKLSGLDEGVTVAKEAIARLDARQT